MRVLITGAYGLIGAAVCVRLLAAGHQVVGLGRAPASARQRLPDVQWVDADISRLTAVSDWKPLLAGIDAVVNCAGALQDSGRDDLDGVHLKGPLALFKACRENGVRRVVQMSAAGADPGGASAFARTKGAVDRALAATDLDWVILRPALVFSPNVYGATALLRGLAGLPFAMPMFAPTRAVAIVGIDDVAATVAWCLTPGARLRATYDLMHPQAVTLRDIVRLQRQWLGFAPAPVVALPAWATRLVSAIADTIAWFGWRSPARSTAVTQITAGIGGDPEPWMAATGIRPASYAAFLAAYPATLQDRWFARLYFLKPLAIAVLASFWIATGLLALGPGYTAAMAHLAEAGVGQTLARLVTIGGAFFDIALGSALLFRRLARATLMVMLAATPCYLLAGTLLAPQLWGDPLGAYTKVFPLLLATGFTLAIIEER